MPIVKSIIYKQSDRGNGSKRVYEQHTDHTGEVHEHRYYTDSKYDTVTALSSNALKVDKSLKEAETEKVMDEVSNGADPELITINHISGFERAIASAKALMTGDPKKLLKAALYGQTLTDAQIDTYLTIAQRNKIRARIQYIINSQAVFNADVREEL